MKSFTLLAFCLLGAGCVVLDNSSYLGVVEADKKEYDDFSNTYTFTFKEIPSLRIVSGAVTSKSEGIGFLVPVVPQSDSSKRLAYEVKSDRRIEVQNTSEAKTIVLTSLEEALVMDNRYGKEGKKADSVEVKANESVWLVFPGDAPWEIIVSDGTRKKVLNIEMFTARRINQVSV
jgi:hypothetical protein